MDRSRRYARQLERDRRILVYTARSVRPVFDEDPVVEDGEQAVWVAGVFFKKILAWALGGGFGDLQFPKDVCSKSKKY